MKACLALGLLMFCSVKVEARPVFSSPSSLMLQTTPGADHLTEEILAVRNKWIEAEEKKDIAFLTELIADDCVIGNSQGQVLKKPQFLERMKDSNRLLRVTNTRNVQVRGYGDIAILSEEVTVEGSDSGKPFGGDFRFIRIFHRESAAWRAVLAQGTPMVKK